METVTLLFIFYRWRYWGPKFIADYTVSWRQSWSHNPEPVGVAHKQLCYLSMDSSSASFPFQVSPVFLLNRK
jgi:hypothetical protein